MRADDLAPVPTVEEGVEHVLALAVHVGGTRLIDNATFTIEGTSVRFDLQGFGRHDQTTRET